MEGPPSSYSLFPSKVSKCLPTCLFGSVRRRLVECGTEADVCLVFRLKPPYLVSNLGRIRNLISSLAWDSFVRGNAGSPNGQGFSALCTNSGPHLPLAQCTNPHSFHAKIPLSA
eukprot:TRINITY_DN2329_c0_g1_i12.p2 TRINITY_DN2329_c0_g1~~TRINITY_DN2329_c0_g1_i12.p2  ORF type:complete len:114 (-),score=0.47 TRINITY_DN2329_c0_g1_i12:624-965(-)